MSSLIHNDLRPTIKSNRHQDGDLLRHLGIPQQASERNPTDIFEFGPGTRPRCFDIGYKERRYLTGKYVLI